MWWWTKSRRGLSRLQGPTSDNATTSPRSPPRSGGEGSRADCRPACPASAHEDRQDVPMGPSFVAGVLGFHKQSPPTVQAEFSSRPMYFGFLHHHRPVSFMCTYGFATLHFRKFHRARRGTLLDQSRRWRFFLSGSLMPQPIVMSGGLIRKSLCYQQSQHSRRG